MAKKIKDEEKDPPRIKQMLRDRIVKFDRVDTSQISDNSANWRTHDDSQRETLQGVVNEIGIAGAMLCYYSARNGNKLTLIDGHLRREVYPDGTKAPILITDLNDEEADLLLLMFDRISKMAGIDGDRLNELLDRAVSDDVAVRELLRKMEVEAREALAEAEEQEEESEEDSPPEMELLPFENYDYIVLCFKSELDWIRAVDVMKLEKASDKRKTGKVGVARALDGARVIDEIARLRENQVKEQTAPVSVKSDKPSKKKSK